MGLGKKTQKILELYFYILFLIPLNALGASALEKIDWKELKSRHTILRYQSQEDLNIFDQKIKYSAASGLSTLARRLEKNNPDERLIEKIDAIYQRVQEILDMRKSMKRIRINIYSTKKQLHKAYFRIYKDHRKLRAWYIFEVNTIFLTVEDVFAGMLAHEMAHSIIDHYLTVRPPPATAEILARYIDSHLVE